MSKEMKGKVRSGLVSAMVVAFMAVAVAMVFPALSRAGSLEPSGPPGPTMKTLDEIPPTWSQKLPVEERFVLVLDDQAVLDKETGLVWERSPSTTKRTWVDAVIYAYRLSLGGRKGWRLPTVEELTSLVDPTRTNPALPSGHPFQNVQSSGYWSSTTHAGSTGLAWHVHFSDSSVGSYDKSDVYYVRCVRGGAGHDAY